MPGLRGGERPCAGTKGQATCCGLGSARSAYIATRGCTGRVVGPGSPSIGGGGARTPATPTYPGDGRCRRRRGERAELCCMEERARVVAHKSFRAVSVCADHYLAHTYCWVCDRSIRPR